MPVAHEPSMVSQEHSNDLRKRQRQAIENDFNNEEMMKSEAAKLLNDMASGKLKKRDLP